MRSACKRSATWPFITSEQRHHSPEDSSSKRATGWFAFPHPPGKLADAELHFNDSNPAAFQQRLAKERVVLSAPQGDTFLVGVNETLNRITANQLAEKLISALA